MVGSTTRRVRQAATPSLITARSVVHILGIDRPEAGYLTHRDVEVTRRRVVCCTESLKVSGAGDGQRSAVLVGRENGIGDASVETSG